METKDRATWLFRNSIWELEISKYVATRLSRNSISKCNKKQNCCELQILHFTKYYKPFFVGLTKLWIKVIYMCMYLRIIRKPCRSIENHHFRKMIVKCWWPRSNYFNYLRSKLVTCGHNKCTLLHPKSKF